MFGVGFTSIAVTGYQAGQVFGIVLTSADRFGSIGIERRFRVAKLDELLLGKRRR